MNTNNFPMSCKDCKHAISENNEQTGCSIDKLKNLSPIKDPEGIFQLNKVCLFKNKEKEDIDIKLGYLFILDQSDKTDELVQNISSIKDKNPLWIGIIHQDIDNNDNIIKILDGLNIKYNIICNYNTIDNLYKLDQFMKNYKNGWTLVNIVGEPFNSSVKEILEKFIIEESGKAAVIKENSDPDDLSINNVCYFNFIYRYLKGSKPELNEEEEMYYTKSFYQKISEKDPLMIKTWKELQ